jgi:hypothetical protein
MRPVPQEGPHAIFEGPALRRDPPGCPCGNARPRDREEVPGRPPDDRQRTCWALPSPRLIRAVGISSRMCWNAHRLNGGSCQFASVTRRSFGNGGAPVIGPISPMYWTFTAAAPRRKCVLALSAHLVSGQQPVSRHADALSPEFPIGHRSDRSMRYWTYSPASNSRHVNEAAVVPLERDRHRGRRTVTVLGHVQIGFPGPRRLPLVHVLTM